MDYQQFKEDILKDLCEFYGNDAQVSIKSVLKNNGKRYDGIFIIHKEDTGRKETIPVIYLDEIYNEVGGNISREECLGMIIDFRERNDSIDEIEQFRGCITKWEEVKMNIYPVLLTTRENKELIETLVTIPFLDLSIAYIIRAKENMLGVANVKITKELLKSYGITEEELHRQAMKNLELDGYCFRNMKNIIDEYMGEYLCEDAELEDTNISEMDMYVLTNSCNIYGAAGILYSKLLKNQFEDRDCYILPSSIHETIFVPVKEQMEQSRFDNMVEEVNGTVVDRGEWLSNHSYFYDAKKHEVRITA